jgi:hypothetical protein
MSLGLLIAMPALAITVSRLSNSYSAVRDLIPRLIESEDATSISMTISWEPEDFGKDFRDSAVATLRTAAITVVFARPMRLQDPGQCLEM